MKQYCENDVCECEAVYEVSVSINHVADEVRSLCATCYEVYIWGVQHGRKLQGKP